MKHSFRAVAAFLMSVMFLAFGSLSAHASSPDPGTTSPIIDEGSMFSPEDKASLTKIIIANHEKYGLFFVIETVPSLNGQNLESVALAHANSLGVGEAGKDNGVLIFLSRDDRKIRFELGKAVNGKISDSAMTSIIDSKVTPQFKAGNYPAGLESGMTAVGSAYLGVTSDSSDNSNSYLNVFLIIGGVLFFLILSVFITRQIGGEPAKARERDREHNKAMSRLKSIKTNVSNFKNSNDVDAYKTLPNEKARLEFLQASYPDFASLLQEHHSSENPSTILLDRVFYSDVSTFGVSFTGVKSNSSVKMYKLFGSGFENVSINEANRLIQREKDIYMKEQSERLKIYGQELRKKEQARKLWNSLPESTRKALKKAKSKEDRLALFASDELSGNFIANYPLIVSMFLSNSSSSSSNSSSSHSSSSSSSSGSSYSPPPSSFDSGSFGGGSFDGGGGSGGW